MRRWRESLGVGTAGQRVGLAAALLVGCLWPAGIAGAAGTGPPLHLTVRPAVGARRTHFVVSFTAQRTGPLGTLSAAYRVVVSGGSGRTCRSVQRVLVPATVEGQRVHAVMAPSGPHGVWCIGNYTGRLQELAMPFCGGKICPLTVDPEPAFSIVTTLKKFHLRVR